MKKKSKWKKLCIGMSLALSLALIAPDVLPAAALTAHAEETSVTITSMAYDDGPNFAANAMDAVSFGFRMPFFNNKANTWSEVNKDLSVKVKVDGEWIDIDSVDSFIYNRNWGHWSDGGANGYWFRVSETTYLQLYSKSDPSVTLDYTLTVNKTDAASVTELAPKEGDTINASRTGTGFIAFPNAIANGVAYPTGAANLVAYVKGVDDPDSAYVNIDNNAASGWIYDSNFGIEENGYWFTVKDSGSINVKLALKDKETVSRVYTITYSSEPRSSYQVYAFEGTTITANSETGACGVVLPLLGGTDKTNNLPTNAELDNFVYQFYDGTNWVNLADSSASGWYYQGDGYVDYSSKNQWGYFDDYVYGLWFQPVTENFKLRIGYPSNGEKGGDVGSNYVEYSFVGAPNAYRPVDVEVGDIIVGGEESDPNALDGWTLYFNEEFDGNALDTNYWSHDLGYFLDPSDPGTKGWGNNEMEYYTDSAENSYVGDGALHLIAKNEPRTFTCTDAAQTQVTAGYSSAKVISKDKVKFTYGRIDFRAKLPAGQGLWPALWMLPNDNVYGTWACSGELDVMEARGRTPGVVTGTIHYGGTWPDNKHTGLDYEFPEGSGFDDGYHVYSAIWEEDNITWYVDGNFYSFVPKSKWWSANSGSDTAPFDQDFYIVMNLAVGGWFDDDILPESDFTSAEMLVDYVRVYKKEGTWEPEEEVAIEALGLDKTSVDLQVGETYTLNKVLTPSNTTQKTVTWTTSNDKVATVSGGKITAVGEGTATITVTSTANSKAKATCTVTVTKAEEPQEVAVTALKLNKSSVELKVGGDETLTVSYTPSNTTQKDVTWTTSNDKVATVSGGKITAVGEGIATITVISTANDTVKATCAVTVSKDSTPDDEVAVSALGLSKSSVALKVGESESLTLAYVPTNTTQKDVTWTTSDDKVATVSDGKIIAVGEGTATITVTSTANSKAKATCTVTVSKDSSGGDDPVVPSTEYGMTWNEDKTLTFYVKAQDSTPGPMLYYGSNIENPTLSKLMGENLKADAALGENYYSFTTTATYKEGDVISYMYGYVPVSGTGRQDSPIVNETLKASSTPEDPEPVTVDKSALQAAVNTCEQLDTTSYTDETVAALQAALTAAKEVLAKEAATQSEVDSALAALNKAKDDLTEKPEPVVDKSALQAAVNTCEQLDTTSYTDETVAALQAALTAAKEVLAKEAATQSEVDSALATLNSAWKGLTEKPEPEPEPEPEPKESVVNVFDDIKEGQWWVSAVQFVYDNGIMAGKGTNFRPEGNITREEFVQTLYNSSGSPALNGTAKDFPDVKAGQWYVNAVKWANENKIASGTGKGTFGVGKNITRQDLAVMLYSYAKLNNYDTTITDGIIDDFSDSAKVSDYAKEALSWAVSQGVMSGKGKAGAAKSEMRLDPIGNATRAECASMMMKVVQANTN
ncbi:MAG: Ig-like domain-containing protein [Lachnospiraceae bacterium]|nr:Ig-like domain-containing protein [Lachnospiraceae bacterium]